MDRGLKALKPILSRTHILFLNRREIRQLTRRELIAGAETCLKYGCRIVVVTLGKGIELDLDKETGYKKALAIAYIRDAESQHAITSSGDVTSIDTTGAGDAFAAGFLYGLIKGKGREECGRLGNIVAQFCISKVGARAGLPTLTELTQRYQQLYSRPL